MAQRIIAWLVNTFWGVIAASVIIVGLFLSLGRYYVPLIDNFRDDFEQQLSGMLSAQVDSDGLIGDWQGFNPIVGVRDLLVKTNDETAPSVLLKLNEAQLEIDMLRSLMALSPVYREALISGLQIHFYKSEQGGWTSPLFHGGGGVDIAQLYGAAHDLRVVNTQLIFHEGTQVNVISLASFSLERGSNLTQSMLSIIDDVNADPMDVVVETSGVVGASNFSLTGYLTANNVDLGPYRFLSSQLLHSDHASLALWANWRTGEALKIHGEISATNFSIGSLKNVATATANIGLSYQSERWTLFSRSAEFESDGQTLRIPDLRIDVAPKTQVSKLSLGQIDLSRSVRLQALIPEKFTLLTSALTALQPKGYLRNTALQLQRNNGKWYTAFAADAVDVSVGSWRGSPALSGVSGRIEHQGRSGWFHSDRDDMSLHVETLYSQAFELKQVQGHVGWDIGEYITIASKDLRANSAYGDINALFNIDMPSPKATEKPVPTLTLQFDLANIPAAAVTELIPKLGQTNAVKEWLKEGNLSGSVPNAKFFINTSISKQEQWYPAIQVVAKAREFSLGVGTQWPRVEAFAPSLLMSNRQLKAFSANGKLLAVDLAPLNVSVALTQHNTNVQLHADGLGPISSALYLFQKTPLANAINHGAEGWSGTGDFRAGVDIAFSLEKLPEVKANVQASIIDASLRLDEATLQFDHVQGLLRYDDGRLTSEQLSADVFAKPWRLALSTEDSTNDYLLAGRGDVNVGDIADWLAQPLLLFLEGETAAQALLRISADSAPELSIDTDMSGVTVNLPKPFQKGISEPLPLAIKLSLADVMLLSVRSPVAQLEAIIGDDARGTVVAGYKQQLLPMPDTGFVLTGGLRNLNGDDATDILNRYLNFEGSYPSEGPAPHIELKDFSIDRLLLSDEFIPTVKVNGHNEGEIFYADLEAPLIKASIRWEDEKPLALNMDYLRYPFKALSSSEIIEPVVPIRPADLIALDISIAQLIYKDENYGSWRFDVEPAPNAVKFNNITGLFKGVQVGADSEGLPASLLWVELEEGQHVSTFQGSFSADNVKLVFENYRLTPMLTSKKAQASLNITWPNEPFNIDHLLLSGDVDFALKDGQFLRTEGAPTGLLKLLGVFNFDNLVRRMRLDFGDLVHEGLSYDRFSGALAISPGAVSLSKPIFVDGPSSDFRMMGSLDLNAQTVDGELIAVVPVSRNLPWLAALAGGLPAAAGVYLASKVFSDGFDRLSSASYSIHGPWAEPEIKFERLFDDKNNVPELKQAPTTGSVEQVEQQAE